jgi:acyl-CoA reductase-like NAD-dependent aldehyde dehydrogenase
VPTEGVANLIAKPGKDTNAYCQHPDVDQIWGVGCNDAGGKYQRVAGDKGNKGTN